MSDPAPLWLAVGRVSKPHGVHGELAVEVVTDFPDRLQPGVEVGLGSDAPALFRKVLTVRWHKGAWLVALEGVRRREEADELRGWWLFLPELQPSERPPTFYYEHELVGCICCREDGRELGTVQALVPGAQMLLAARTEAGGEVLVPFVSPIVVRVDLETRRIVLDPPSGLFDGDAL
ncbi:MAG TPA: ribosome maturation factor RimM [Thermoanaerobaculaceae bacterium]|nr:ribosome maturation factor RimM [Thermoanaerobaculaceae bacterium]HRS15955.1 ribosome maturation factor RimM [Thermoanaerobaculaceae bacterium]